MQIHYARFKGLHNFFVQLLLFLALALTIGISIFKKRGGSLKDRVGFVVLKDLFGSILFFQLRAKRIFFLLLARRCRILDISRHVVLTALGVIATRLLDWVRLQVDVF